MKIYIIGKPDETLIELAKGNILVYRHKTDAELFLARSRACGLDYGEEIFEFDITESD